MTIIEENVVTWFDVCAFGDLTPGRGAAALLPSTPNPVQVAVFVLPVTHEVYAVANYDPFSAAPVLSRGIVGTRGDAPKVASPIYKQTFDLRTGVCFEDESVVLPTYPVRVVDGRIEIGVGP